MTENIGGADQTAEVQQDVNQADAKEQKMIPESEFNKVLSESISRKKEIKELKEKYSNIDAASKKAEEEKLKEQQKYKELSEAHEKKIKEMEEKFSKLDTDAYEKTTEIMTGMINDLKAKVTDKAVLELLEEKSPIQQYEWLTNYVKEQQKGQAAVHTARAGGLPVEAPTSFENIMGMKPAQQNAVAEKYPDLYKKLYDDYMSKKLK
jgi:Ca2+-binding EF-hand superfamily protein